MLNKYMIKKIVILIPVFNDWESLKKLLSEVNENVTNFQGIHFECLVVNDSSTIDQPNLTRPSNIKSLEILNMKENRGHARCNAFGIRYIFQNKKFDNLILMDGDGEDRPVEIKSLVKKIKENPNLSVVAKRVKRSEGIFFQSLYQLHKIITIIFTGQNINFGNYCLLTRNDVEKLHSKASLWSSFSGSVKKNLRTLNEINSIRGLRYFGPSKMSFKNLLIHSLSIITVFKINVLIRSILFFLVYMFLIYQNITIIMLTPVLLVIILIEV